MSIEWIGSSGDVNHRGRGRSSSDATGIKRNGGSDQQLPLGYANLSAPLLRIETEKDFSSAFNESKTEKKSSVKCVQCISICKREFLYSRFPVLQWMPQYKWRQFALKDVLVGVTLGFVIAPKAMAHALLAELPPIFGLYTAFFATLIYGSMGNSKWLSVGTCALPALLFGEALVNHVENEEEFVGAHSMLTLYIALATAVLGLLRLDKFLRCISPVALSAFTTTAAFIIATSQMKYMLGLHIKTSGFVNTYVEIFKHISEVNVVTLILGLLSIGFLFASKWLSAKYLKPKGIPDPGAILLVVLSVVLVILLDLDKNYAVDVVGPTERGLPQPQLPWIHVSDIELHGKLMLDGFLIAVINYLLAMAIVSSFAEKSKEKARSGQELIALTTVNFVGSWFQTFVAGGSFSGSALIMSYNASSLLHNFVNSFIMLMLLLFMTPLIEPLPRVTLAAIIIVALPRLVDFQRPRKLYRIKFDEFLLWVATFVITLFAGTQYGIIAGICLSLAVLLVRSISAPITEVGNIPQTGIYRSLERFPDARQIPNIRIFRLDSSVNFANAAMFKKRLSRAIFNQGYAKPTASKSSLRRIGRAYGFGKRASTPESPAETFACDDYVLLSCEAVNDLDTTAITVLNSFAKECKVLGIKLRFSGFKASIRETLYRVKSEANKSELEDTILDSEHWFLNLHDAVFRAKTELGQRNILEFTPTLATTNEDQHPSSPSRSGHTVEITQSGEQFPWSFTLDSPTAETDVEMATISGSTRDADSKSV